MDQNEAKSVPTLGFITVIEDENHGHFGGLLVLNSIARPLEFHCTMPVKTTRAQEILYGQTLLPYLYGEQIAQSLVKKTTSGPTLIFTNLPEVLAVTRWITQPVLLLTDSESDARRNTPIVESQHSPLSQLKLGENRLAYVDSQRDLIERAIALIGESLDTLDLEEPFTRIRDAILEAQKTGKKAA